jgi:hypothetical protein
LLRSGVHSEPVLRVHLAPYGSKADLVRALEQARSEAEELIRQAAAIGLEFVEGHHQFQDQVHIRAMLFDYLWSCGMSTYAWATRSLDRVNAWEAIEPTADTLETGRRHIEYLLAAMSPTFPFGDPPTRSV